VTLADWERRNLERIEQELATADPALARLLNAPGRWRRMFWGPRRGRFGTILLTLAAAGCVLALALAR